MAKLLGKELVDAGHVVSPMDQVVGSHQHESSVIAPSELVGAFPLGSADALLLAENVEVGHGDIELAVRRTVDMRVTDAVLLGDAVARDNRLTIVHRRKRIAIVADGHEQRMRRIAKEGEEIGTHVLLGEATVSFCHC